MGSRSRSSGSCWLRWSELGSSSAIRTKRRRSVGIATDLNIPRACACEAASRKAVIDPGFLQDCIGSVARLADMVDRNGSAVRPDPDVMRPFSRTMVRPAVFPQKLLDQLFVTVHAQAAASVYRTCAATWGTRRCWDSNKAGTSSRTSRASSSSVSASTTKPRRSGLVPTKTRASASYSTKTRTTSGTPRRPRSRAAGHPMRYISPLRWPH